MFNSVFGEKLYQLVKNKRDLIVNYDRLSENLRKPADREQISIIAQEEEKHIKMIQSIYSRALDGRMIICPNDKAKVEQPNRLLDKLMYTETENIRILKSLILSIGDIRIKNGLYYILTDDQRHSDIIIYLFTKYS